MELGELDQTTKMDGESRLMLYKEYLETPLIDATQDFYATASDQLFGELPFVEFANYVSGRYTQ